MAVMCVCGKFRTGKSYLLNKAILGENKAFEISPTINACTKGIWIWKKPYKLLNPNNPLNDAAVLVLDAEGIGSLDGDAEHDSKIMLLGLLLSSLLIYNSVGAIDEHAVSSLSLVVELSKKLQDDSKCENPGKNFPAFLWVLRDFALQLEDKNGDAITPKQYLEKALSAQKGSSETIEEKNRTRQLLKTFFTDRDCSVLVRPTEDEVDLQNLENVPNEKLRKEFLDQLDAFKGKIKKRLKEKHVNGKRINGIMLAELCLKYTEAINNGQVPQVENTWINVCKAQCEFALQECESLYLSNFTSKLLNMPIVSKQEMKKVFELIYTECHKLFKNRMVGDIDSNESLSFKKLVAKLKEECKIKLREKYCEEIKKYFIEQQVEIMKKDFIEDSRAELVKIMENCPLKNAMGYQEICNEIFPKIILDFYAKMQDKNQENIKIHEQTIELKNIENNELQTKINFLQEQNKVLNDQLMNELHEKDKTIMMLKSALATNEENLAAREKENTVLSKKLLVYEGPTKILRKTLCETARAAIASEKLEKENGYIKNPEAIKNLENALDHLQRHCVTLEAKIKHEKRFKEVLLGASHIKCKKCGQLYACNIFAAHIKLCDATQISASKAIRNKAFTQVFFELLIKTSQGI